MGTVFALHDIYPFGGRQILVTDFWQQYYPFFSDYWHKLREGSSLLWSWTSGAGMNYLALVAYYLASPLNLLIAAFPHSFLREAVTLILLVKIGFAGLFFAMYLRYAFRRRDLSLPAFSLFYALCAFTLGYYWNIMWFDTFALLPLVMLGVHSLVREGRWRLYVIALTPAVLINYYIGLFVCIYTVFMFALVCVDEKPGMKMFWRRALLIAVCSVVAIGITAVLSVPTFLSLQKTYSVVNSFPTTPTQYENYFDILGNFIAFTPPTDIEGLPNLYCGMLCILLLGPFLRSSKISLQGKIAYVGLTAFLIVSCNLNILNYIWHGFHFTNQLPYRFSFLISFTVAVMAYYRYSLIDDMDYWDLLFMGAAALLFLGCAAIGPQSWGHVAASAGVCAAYIAFFAVRIYALRRYELRIRDSAGFAEENRPDKKGRIRVRERKQFPRRGLFDAVLLVIVLAEVAGTSYIGVGTVRTTDRDSYLFQYDDVRNLLDMREPAGNGFYRTESVSWYTLNDPAFYGYDGISVFSSTVNRSSTGFMLGLGLYGAYAANRYAYYQTSPLTDAFLNIRYLYTATGAAADDSIFREQIGNSGYSRLLENKAYLPLGFMAEEELAGYARDETDAFKSQNDLFRRATGLDGDLFYKFDIIHVGHKNYHVTREELGRYDYALNDGFTEGTLKWNYEMPTYGPLYIFVKIDNTKFADSIKVIVNGNERCSLRGDHPILLCAGTLWEGDIVSVITDIEAKSGKATIYAAVIDHELFWRGYELLADETLELTEFSDTRVKGTVTALQDGLLYTSIPYEKGWSAFVGGAPAEILTVDGSMAALRLPAGTHEVEFRYINDGLVPGAVISALSLAAFAGMVVFERKRGGIMQGTRQNKR